MGLFDADPEVARRRALVFWAISGIPLITGLLQGIGAILGSPIGGWPAIGYLASEIHEIEIFRLMSLVGEDQPVLVATLFVLTGLAWAGFGFTLMKDKIDFLGYAFDDVRSGMTALSGILYGILFIGVFGHLIFANVSLAQRSVLFVLPGIAICFIILARGICPDREATLRVIDAKKSAEDHLEDFETLMSQRFGGESIFDRIKELPEFNSTSISDAERRWSKFKNTTDVEKNESISKDEAIQIEEDVKSLSPSETVDKIEDEIRESLSEYTSDRYGSINIKTPFGIEYNKDNITDEVSINDNLNNQNNKVNIKDAGSELSSMIKDREISIEDALDSLNRLEQSIFGTDNEVCISFPNKLISGTSLSESVNATEASNDIHRVVNDNEITYETAAKLFSIIESELKDREGFIPETRYHEADITAKIYEAEAGIKTFEQTLENQFGPNIQRNLEHIYLDNERDSPEPLSTVVDVREYIEAAKDRLEDFRFNAAERKANAAADLAGELVEITTSFDIVQGYAKQGKKKTSLPDPNQTQYNVYNHSVLQRIKPGFRLDYDVSLNIDENAGEVQFEYGSSKDKTGTSGDEGRADAKLILDKLYDLARRNDQDIGDGELVASTDGGVIPSVYVSSASLKYLRDFCNENDRFHGGFQITDRNDRIIIQSADGHTIEWTLKNLTEKFDTWRLD